MKENKRTFNKYKDTKHYNRVIGKKLQKLNCKYYEEKNAMANSKTTLENGEKSLKLPDRKLKE